MIRLSEIFYSIQGEGPFQGLSTLFVRLTGCDLRCSWCDTSHAFHGGESYTLPSLVAQVLEHDCRRICITGGEPLLQAECPELMQQLLDAGCSVSLETGGHRDLSAVPKAVTQVVDVKCPGSGEGGSFRLSNLKHLRTGDALKFVVASPEDIDWLESFLEEQEIPSGVELFVSPVPGQMDPPLLAERILQSPHPLRLGLQLHKILWGDDIQGR